MKKTKRKGFTFLRSYFDVLNKIPSDDDKLQFLLAIIDKQFINKDPENLSLISELAYESQRHSVETSIKGYMGKMKTDLTGKPIKAKVLSAPLEEGSSTPWQGGSQGGSQGGKQGGEQGGEQGGSPTPWQQEKEKEKEKEKEQEKEVIITISHNNFLKTLKQKSQWLEVVAMQQKTKNEIVLIYLDKFENHLITMQEQKKNIKDFKSHFVFWLNKQDLSQFREKTIGKSNQIR